MLLFWLVGQLVAKLIVVRLVLFCPGKCPIARGFLLLAVSCELGVGRVSSRFIRIVVVV